MQGILSHSDGTLFWAHVSIHNIMLATSDLASQLKAGCILFNQPISYIYIYTSYNLAVFVQHYITIYIMMDSFKQHTSPDKKPYKVYKLIKILT